MTPATQPPPRTRRRPILRSFGQWTWTAVALSILTCAIITWQHYSQADTIARTQRLVTLFGEARIDLSNGVLNLMASDDPRAPLSRETGLALLDQALQEFRDAYAAALLAGSIPEKGKDAPVTFSEELAVLRGQIAAYRESDPSARSDSLLPLNLSIHRLDNLALALDDRIRSDLGILTARHNLAFAITLVVAALLVAAMSLGAIQAARAQKAAELAERSHREAIRDSESRQALALEAAQAGTWEWDLATGRNLWSEELWKIYGLEPHSCEPSYEAWMETVHPDDRYRIGAYLQDTANREADISMEWRIRNQAGGISWLMSHGHPFRDASGRAVRYMGVVMDITERKRAEESLRKHEEQLLLFVEQAPAALAMFDRQMICLAASHRWLSDFRVTREQVLGRRHYDTFPEITERIREAHRQGLLGNGSSSEEDIFRRADGSIQWLRWEVQPWKYATGEVGGIIILSEDISDTRKAASELARSREKLEATLNALPSLLFELDDTGVFVDYRASAMSGLYTPPSVFLGKRPRDVLPPEPLEAIERAMEEAWNTGRHAGCVYSMLLEGRTHWFELSISQKPEPEKPRPHLVVLAQDVTERHQAELIQETIYRITEAAHLSQSLGEFYRSIYSRITEVMVADRLFILLRDENADLVRIVFAVDESGKVREGDVLPADEHGLAVRILRTAEPLLFHLEDTSPELHSVFDVPFKVQIGAPLIVQGRVIGAILLQNLEGNDDYTEQDLRVLTVVSSQIAAAVEQRRSADALRQNQALLEQAQSIAGLGSFEVDLATGATTWTRQMYAHYGLDPSGKPLTPDRFAEILDMLHPDDRSALDEAFGEVAGKGVARGLEYRTNPGRGPMKWLRVSMIPEKDMNGAVTRITGTVLDVTAEKAAQSELERRVEERTAELRRSEETYRALFDDSSDAIFLANADGSVANVNRAAIAMLGFTMEDYRTKGPVMMKLFPDQKIPLQAGSIGQALSDRCGAPFETWVRAKDGSRVEIEVSVSVLHDPYGQDPQFQLVARNITARKQTAAALIESRDRLAEANEALRNAARMKDEFFANMSHEIRTPMNAIIGLSDLALKTDLNPRQRDYLHKVHNAGVSLLGVINDILDFSKIDAGKISLENIPFDLDTVLDELGTIMSQKMAEKGLELVLGIPPELSRAWNGDPLRLGQVLLNLVSNAAKFTEHGEVKVAVSVAETMGAKSRLLFEVSDTGIGMSAADMKRIFQAFTQADSSTTRRFGGTGLGLHISKRLVELMGGRIWAESVEGKGSTFRFTVWLERGSGKPGFEERIPAGLAGVRALVVDDMEASRLAGRDIMAALHFRAETARSGEEALEMVSAAEEKGDGFGIILMDYWMPGGMDGIAATKLILSGRDPARRPRIFMVTGSAGESARREADAAGVSDFLLKPLTMRSITEALAQEFATPGDDASRDAVSLAARPHNLTGLRVLLVEDMEINRMIARELLESAGATVAEAHDGEEAVAAFGRDPSAIDLILMDIQMPLLDGYEATRRIRADRRSAGLPIVAMTAYAMESDRQKALEAGMDDHITKPIEPEILFQTLERLGKDRIGASAASVEKAPRGDGRADADIPATRSIDTKKGISLVAGNVPLYLELLRNFQRGQSSSPAKAQSELDQGRTEEAGRTVHSLKGLAGNIGAASIHGAADRLETLLRRNGDIEAIRAALAVLRESMDAALPEIEEILSNHAVRSQDEAPRTEAGIGHASGSPREILATIGALVASSDTEALVLFRKARPKLEKILGGELLEDIQASLETFDFRNAERLLASIQGRKGRRG